MIFKFDAKNLKTLFINQSTSDETALMLSLCWVLTADTKFVKGYTCHKTYRQKFSGAIFDFPCTFIVIINSS